MSAHYDSLTALYSQQVKRKYPLYDLFKIILENFDELKTTCKLYLSVGNEKTLVRFLCKSNPEFRRFNSNMLDWIGNGDVHLRQKFCSVTDTTNTYLLLCVFRDVLNGLTTRQIAEKNHISLHTIKKCKAICINYLAYSYNCLMCNKKSA